MPSWENPYFATQIGQEQIVVITNKQNPLDELSTEVLRQLFDGQVSDWSELKVSFRQGVQVWDYPAGEDLHQILSAALWGAEHQPTKAYLAPDPAAMLEAVSADPGAIGYLPASWVEASDLKVISVETGLSTALRQPVLLLTAEEPQGLLRAWVSCLQ